MVALVYRVQHRHDGRGPWRPGFSGTWCDDSADAAPLAEHILDLLTPRQVYGLRQLVDAYGLHIGHGCRTLAQLLAWFTPVEQQRLAGFDYVIVRLSVDVVLVESQRQLLFGRRRPLTDGATVLRWPQLQVA